jgi:hypothetical protein
VPSAVPVDLGDGLHVASLAAVVQVEGLYEHSLTGPVHVPVPVDGSLMVQVAGLFTLLLPLKARYWHCEVVPLLSQVVTLFHGPHVVPQVTVALGVQAPATGVVQAARHSVTTPVPLVAPVQLAIGPAQAVGVVVVQAVVALAVHDEALAGVDQTSMV